VSLTIAARALDLAYEQLRGQKDDLRHYRNQASICAAICGLVGTFFAQITRAAGIPISKCDKFCIFGIEAWLLVALASVFFSILFAIAAIITWTECTFELQPDRYRYAVEYGEPETEFYLSMANEADKFFEENENVVYDVKLKLTASCLMAWLQIPAWMLFIF
jgi:hypothetical protein